MQGRRPPPGFPKNPIKLYFTPSIDAQTITKESATFVQYLEKESGLFFEVGVPASYIAVVEAFGSKRADIAVMNSPSYLMVNKKYQARALLKVIRYGKDHYRGQIIVGADKNINSIKDLHNKSFAFTDPNSASGHYLPKKILEDHGIVPSHTTFANKHDNVVTMVYQGQVDAGATYYATPSKDGKIRDARLRVKTQFPDVEKKVKILTITDPIPNDIFVFRKDLPQEITQKFIHSLKKYIATPEGKSVFKAIYSVEGVADTQDKDYDRLRNVLDKSHGS